ncbi:uncharacterized protein LOC129292835 [Prosopis cineraria]|uniref:uncharacterized protein LOC129292835 n=1 Tax=Prosopis cineraria TaxID=364024 RepID=UPI00240EEB59|nr:uncharacterized protein LOC129292835 [Prosopis cineraria]
MIQHGAAHQSLVKHCRLSSRNLRHFLPPVRAQFSIFGSAATIISEKNRKEICKYLFKAVLLGLKEVQGLVTVMDTVEALEDLLVNLVVTKEELRQITSHHLGYLLHGPRFGRSGGGFGAAPGTSFL